LLRRVKRGYLEAGFSLPDPNREVIFPQPVPVRMLEATEGATPPRTATNPPPRADEPATDEAAAGPSEGRLSNETDSIKEQARRSRVPEGGIDLLGED
ncbi:MAG: hypothetical protein ACLFR7_09525, partial [Opitutales bacterium]